MDKQKHPLEEGFLVAARVHMARRGMSQRALVAATGRSEPYWSKRLRGVHGFTLDDVARMSEAFEISPEQLMADAVAEMGRQAAQPDPDLPDLGSGRYTLAARRMSSRGKALWAELDTVGEESQESEG